MAELVDARDLGSRGLVPWGVESPLSHVLNPRTSIGSVMTLDPSRLDVSVQEKERWHRHMTVTVPAAVVREEEQKAARQLASKAKLKGFRKGHVPARVIESRFAGELRKETLDKLISDAYRQALAREELRPITEGAVEDVQYSPEEDLVFSITFDIEPEIELERIGGFTIERSIQEITDEQVQDALNRIQEQNGVWKPEEEGKAEDGNFVSVKLLRLDETDAEMRDYEFVLGKGDAIPDIEAAIKKLDVGSENDFEISFPKNFDEEDQQTDESEHVRITLVSRRILELPEMNDELASQVGDFETFEELTEKVREEMEKESADQADAVVRTQLLDLVADANPFEIPVSMVNRYIDTILGNLENIPEEKIAEARQQVGSEAERAVKRALVLDQIAETQELQATSEEVDARVEEIAEANDATAAQVYASLQKAGRLEPLERNLTEMKVFEFLQEQSEITTL